VPNQRKKGKTVVSVWLDEDQRKKLEELALSMGVDMSTVFKMAIDEELKRSEHDNKNKDSR